jgi:manganese/iron transport system substrate-binding protein
MKSLVVLSGLSLIAFLSSCGMRSAMSPRRGLPQVVATNSVLCDLTQQIAQDSIDLACLVSAGTDPHLYTPTPDNRKRIETASLILYGGYNLEPALEKLIKATPQKIAKVAISEVAVPKPLMSKTGADPHVWHNVQNAIALVNAISDNLAKTNPEQAEVYKTRTKILTQQFTSLDSWVKTQIATIPAPNRTIVTTHDAMEYYSKAYGLAVEPLEGISTKDKPTAARTKAVIDLLRSKKVPAIFAETSINPLLINRIARDTPVKIAREPLYTDGLSTIDSGGGTYQRMIVSNTRAIVDNLGGKYKRWRS